MRRSSMFLRILGKSLWERKGRVFVALLAVIIGASVSAALISISYDVNRKMSRELRTYGANLMLLPEMETFQILSGSLDLGRVSEERYIDEGDIGALETVLPSDKLFGYAPYLYTVVEADSQQVVLVGTWFDQVKEISPWWKVEGKWVEDRSDLSGSLVGKTLAEALNLKIGSSFEVKYEDGGEEKSQLLTISGIVTTGSSEDSQVFVNLPLAQALIGRQGFVNLVALSILGDETEVESLGRAIEVRIPGVQAKPIRRITRSEGLVLNKIQFMIFLVTGVILIASGLCVMTTMADIVLERRTEIGLMKAIGAGKGEIAILFLSEAGVIGLVGGGVGFGVGFILAQLIGESIFSSPISFRFAVTFIVIGISLGLTLLASLLPTRRAVGTEPAKVLRGE